MASTSLTASYLTPDPSFNWFFLLELIVSLILALFFLLYFNRLFATLLSYAIRAYTWHYYRVYVDIKALQISLLGGRVFFKGIRYHGVNETIFIHGGFVTWRYWKRTVERTDLTSAGDKKTASSAAAENQNESNATHLDESIGEQGGVGKTTELPCRISITIYGLEWFIYNRTPAYDSILAGFGHHKNGIPREDDESSIHPSEPESKPQHPDGDSNAPSDNATGSNADNTSEHSPGDGKPLNPRKTKIRESELSDPVSNLLQLLPVKLECKKGAIVMGNENTRSVLAATFDGAEGTIAACKAGPLDLYRQLFSFKFDRPVIQMRPNPDFKQSHITTAKMLSAMSNQDSSKESRGYPFSYRFHKRKIWHSVRELIPYFQTSVESFHASIRADENIPRRQVDFPDVRWHGLSRYLDEENDDDHEKWNSVEYGRFSTILEAPSLSLTYFWDIPGRVGPQIVDSVHSNQHTDTNINNALPPEWGIDLKIDGGTINYGPWADRERVGLQNVFFPNFFRSSEPAEQLAPGVLRQSTVFRLRVEINEELTFRIPTREPSKDWMWKGRAEAIRGASKAKKPKDRRKPRQKEAEKGHIGPDIRPFGWLSLRVGPDSTVKYTMDMVASKVGFRNELSLDLRDSKMSSSVNHGLLWQCPRHLITCDLSNPLSWNSMRSWRFTVESQDLELFLLRDHIFLITDLVSDWASGPPSDYHTFVPFIYHIDLIFSNVQLYINVNERNIISNPSDKGDNRFIVIKGKDLIANVMIPLNKYQPEQNSVDFKVLLENGGVDYLIPPWDTLHAFLPEKALATLESLIIDGSYNYFLDTSSELTDTLRINIGGVSPRLCLYGFLIKSFMAVRENYFGDEMHFKTLEEYQELAYADARPSNFTGINPNRKSNDMDVLVHVAVDNACALLPESIYDHSRCARMRAASLEVDLRFTNYYMDMQLSISPLKLDLQSRLPDGSFVESNTQLFLDGISAYGHRLFGLPPAEPTYVCNWDFDVGQILGECSVEFVACLASGVKSFEFSFDNEENALHPLFPPILHDVTFLRANIASIHLSVLLGENALILDSQPMSIKFNDWANSQFSKRLSFTAPGITIAAVDRQAASECLRMADKTISPLGLFELAIALKMALRQRNITDSRRLQQEHIKIHDQRTHRAQWLLFDWEEIAPTSSLPHADDILSLPTMPIPSMPEPINEHGSKNVFHRGVPGSRSTTSIRSFLVHHETSSLRNVNAPVEKSSRSSSRSGPKQRPLPLPRDGSRSTLHLRTAKGTTKSQTNLRDANPWIVPNFSFYKLSFDKTELPSAINEEDTSGRDHGDIGVSNKSMFLTFEDNQTTYTNFAIQLPRGIKGFCTPKFLRCVASFLDGMNPRDPVQIIDTLQKDVISDIVGYEKAMRQPKKSTSVALRVPKIELRLVDTSESRQIEFRDEYTISANNLCVEFQKRVERLKGDLLEGLKQGITVHASADHVHVSVEGSRADTIEEKAMFNCDLNEINSWLVTEPNICSHLQMRDFNTVTSAKSVERLAFLVRRATTMLDSVASSFRHISTASERRLRFLVYSLAKSADEVADPIFLTRISNVLRIASSHLRLHDSWKIISRIRHLYISLPPRKKRELDLKCQGDNFLLPSDAKSTVLNGFDQWRAWDLAHVDRSYVMRRIWSIPETTSEKPEPLMSLSCTVRALRLSLDPGPRENDFIVENLSAVASRIPNQAVQDGNMASKSVATLQLYSSSAALRLRWEVVDLIEGVVKVMSPVTLESSPAPTSPAKKEQKLNEVQVIFGTDFGSVTLDAINLKLALVSKALRASVVHSSKTMNETKTEDLALLFSAEACSSELLSQSRTLMLSKIADPYLYLSLLSDENELESKHEWKVAGSCRKLRYYMKEDPVSLAHTADRVIEDEIWYIRQLVDSLNPRKPLNEKATASKRPTHTKIHVAMFLDDYRISFSLLPSLTYLISGDVARMSVMPTETSKIEIDFDIKRNSHTFTSGEGGRSRTLSMLEIPPTNGRVLANILPERKEVEFDMTVELIRLEASAVRSLLGVLTGPDVSHLISDLKQNVNVLQSHLQDALGLQKFEQKREPNLAQTVLLYKSCLTVAGLEIHAIAPGLNSNSYSAEMIFNLGMMQMRLQNGLDRGYPMEFPEFGVDAAQISVGLLRQERSKSKSYGGISAGVKLQGTSTVLENGEVMRVFHLTSEKLDVELFAETAALVVDIAIYTQERIKTLDLSHEVERLRRLRHRNQHPDRPRTPLGAPDIHVNDEIPGQTFLNALFSLEFQDIQVAWNMTTPLPGESASRQPEDLIFSIQKVELSNKKKNAAKLRIENMQLQMVPFRADRRKRSLNSALMPELVFNVAYYSSGKELWLAFQAAGKSLDIRATSEFVIPANMLRNSIGSASEALREGKAAWATKPSPDNGPRDTNLFGNKRLRSVLVDVDFAGATVSLQGKQSYDSQTLLTATLKGSRLSESKYGQYVQGDSATSATLRAPGVALKVQWEDNGTSDPALNAELKVDPSSNVLYPTLVPLVKQMSATVKEIMGDQQQSQPGQSRRPSTTAKLQPQKLMQENTFGTPDPNSILGRCKVNLGLLFCKQEFSLSCQPIARVAATAQFESVYVTVNTVQSADQVPFLALSLAFNGLQASVKHVYSNESTASFEVQSMVLSLMNSKHLGRRSGMSAILRVSPMKVAVNAKQIQDSLLFREIWLPSDDEEPVPMSPLGPEQSEAQTYIVQRYQQVASTSVFPWNTTLAVEKVEIALDLGSTLGKAQFSIQNFWVSSSKTSDREQSMCVNFDSVGIECKGRLAGIVELHGLKVRTSIKWPEEATRHTPLIQALVAFHHLQAKLSFDYQPFLVAHITEFNFLMYNVREGSGKGGERLFSILEGDEVQVFCTSLSASQILAVVQAWQRLVQDKQSAYEASLREVERYLRRRSSAIPGRIEAHSQKLAQKDEEMERAPGSLHTGVVVTIRHVNLGAFPSSFFDNQIFKVEAHDAQARFGVSLESNKIHSALGLTLGQLRVALSGINRPPSANLDELSVAEIAQRAAGSRGGTILKVPRLVAGMETWQVPGTRQIDYIFHSTFEGKVDVGWNYSRISFIRDMWETHSRALATRLGKPLPPSAVRITGGPKTGASQADGGELGTVQQDKITAVVHVPQSKYTYTALEPPVIETPQLRDMGEATPPLEWIGLQREKLPNVTHQIIIVTLLEIAKEVEDAYGKILGG